MVLMQDALPRIKHFLQKPGLNEHAMAFVTRLMIAFVLRFGRMSASQAAGAVRSDPRHRAAVARFLANCGWSRDFTVLLRLADLVLQYETQRGGRWLFIVDQTYCSQQGRKTENTIGRASSPKPSKRSKRGRKASAKRRCHCFVMGLLITPGGLRIPCCRCYYTKAHCQQQKQNRKKNRSKNPPQLVYRRQTELAAELIRSLVVPASAQVVVLGDTAFDAAPISQACRKRNFIWIVPVNPERVLAAKKPRPKVWSLVSGFSADQFVPVRLAPGRGRFVAQRRAARCRIGPKAKSRTFYVHQESHDVHSVGQVQLVFSTRTLPKQDKAVAVEKILMTNDLKLSAALIVELYDLRWQIELFFKELKSTLGLHQYRFEQFAKVERWVEACLITFLYLEWYRAGKLHRRDLSEEDKQWWRWQRCHGLCMAIRQEAEEKELSRLAKYSETKTGLKKLKRILRAALPLEYRKAG